MTSDTYRTGIGVSDVDSIMLLGHDLATELIGQVSFGELAYWLIAKRRPTPVSGRCSKPCSSPSPTTASRRPRSPPRLTLLSAPESIQGALAAGLLGGGSRFLGVTEDAATFLHAVIAALDAIPTDEAGWDAVAADVVDGGKSAGRFVPGLGHPVHKHGDPRTPVLFALARDHDVLRAPPRAVRSRSAVCTPAVLGKTLPLNGAGVCGAVLADIDMPLGVVRGVALLARCAGLLGHLAEELDDPIAIDMYMNIDRNTDYQTPEP